MDVYLINVAQLLEQVKMEKKWIFLGIGAIVLIVLFMFLFPFKQSIQTLEQTREVDRITVAIEPQREEQPKRELTFCESKAIEIDSIKVTSNCEQDSDCVKATTPRDCTEVCVSKTLVPQLNTLISEYNQNSCEGLSCGPTDPNAPATECICFTGTCIDAPLS